MIYGQAAEASYRSADLYQPERRLDPPQELARGILVEALRDVLIPDNPCDRFLGQLCEDAALWFFSDETHPGSLRWVCQALRLDPWSLRLWICNYRKSEPERREGMSGRLLQLLAA